MISRPNRHSIRLRDWDYAAPGTYFVTICTSKRDLLFDDSRLREVAECCWLAIPTHPHAWRVRLDEWIVMPNHVHGLITLSEQGYDRFRDKTDRAGTIGSIVGNYKGQVTKRAKVVLRCVGSDLRVWQRGYWDRIVRNERELQAIREYIRLNPARWEADRENLDALLERMERH